MNIKEITVFVVLSVLGILYSCADNTKSGTDAEEEKEITEIKAREFLGKPDSLRSTEEKELFKQLEAVLYEDCRVENNRLELLIDKKEWKKRGFPEVIYDMAKKDIVDINNWLDTVSPPFPNLFEQSFKDAQEEYRARKKSQNEE